MTTRTLAIGRYPDRHSAELVEQFQAILIEDLAGIAQLSDEQRGNIVAVAYYGHDRFDGAVMDRLPQLGIVANFGVGYDAISVPDAVSRGVRVTNTPDVLNDDVADLAVAMLLAQGRNIVEGDRFVRSGDWATGGSFPLNRKLSGGKAGILGLGRIGRDIAQRLSAFQMEIHYHSRSEKKTPGWTYHKSPVSLAAAVDYLLVSLVGGEETRGFVSREVLAALGSQAVVINISRGSTIDEAALLEALESKRIAGAGLDVFLNEPAIDSRFYSLRNVVLQPHQGSGTVETRDRMAQLQRDNIAAFLSGLELKTPVN